MTTEPPKVRFVAFLFFFQTLFLNFVIFWTFFDFNWTGAESKHEKVVQFSNGETIFNLRQTF